MHAVNLGKSAVRGEKSNLREICCFDYGNEMRCMHLTTVITVEGNKNNSDCSIIDPKKMFTYFRFHVLVSLNWTNSL